MKNKVAFSFSRFHGSHAFFMALAALLVCAMGQTATKRCDLLANTTPGTGADTACLDLVALTSGGAPIVTGSNVTRISNSGLKFCKNAFTVTSGGGADVVFIVDNSGSMWSNRAYVTGTDTSFFDQQSCRHRDGYRHHHL